MTTTEMFRPVPSSPVVSRRVGNKLVTAHLHHTTGEFAGVNGREKTPVTVEVLRTPVTPEEREQVRGEMELGTSPADEEKIDRKLSGWGKGRWMVVRHTGTGSSKRSEHIAPRDLYHPANYDESAAMELARATAEDHGAKAAFDARRAELPDAEKRASYSDPAAFEEFVLRPVFGLTGGK